MKRKRHSSQQVIRKLGEANEKVSGTVFTLGPVIWVMRSTILRALAAMALDTIRSFSSRSWARPLHSFRRTIRIRSVIGAMLAG